MLLPILAILALGVSTQAAGARGNPFAARGMWIWELSSSNSGSLGSIIARAHLNGITTLLIKSGDGSGTWSQFNRSMVATFHRAGLNVCAWQYVYGNDPVGEARVGAAAVRDGADCLLIDAETEYEGKYVSAQTYLTTLRKLIGRYFPVALAGFPYVDYHPAFPYSVFLGPGGAQYNVPQMYWRDIGVSVDTVYAHTFAFNRPYGRPIAPLGQVYNSPPAGQIIRFRQLSRAYGAPNVSWWDWQEGNAGAFHAASRPVGGLSGFTPYRTLATLPPHAQGDLVVWAQEHLISAGQNVAVDGDFGPSTLAAVKRFQAAKGLTADGVIGTATWTALLRYREANVTWVIKKKRQQAVVASGGARQELVPKSAKLHAKHNEIPPSLGSGR
ncbi:MAG: peptidoglycan-binding protein [Actinomycetota bacterium]|nr:peptidoglycan-binding protein [Actinomycetota bacterium]